MLDQPLQLAGVIVGQGLDGGFVEHLAAEGPPQVQLAAEHLPVQGQDMDSGASASSSSPAVSLAGTNKAPSASLKLASNWPR